MCKHNHTTLTHHAEILNDDQLDNVYVEFYAYQCDDCGMLTGPDVSAEQMDKSAAAKFDVPAYHQALDQVWRKAFPMPEDKPEVKASRFVQMAVKHGRR